MWRSDLSLSSLVVFRNLEKSLNQAMWFNVKPATYTVFSLTSNVSLLDELPDWFGFFFYYYFNQAAIKKKESLSIKHSKPGGKKE